MPVTRAMAKGTTSSAAPTPAPAAAAATVERKKAKVRLPSTKPSRTTAAAATPTPPIPPAAVIPPVAVPSTKPTTSTTTNRRNVKKVKTKTKPKGKSTYPGKQPTLFDDSDSATDDDGGSSAVSVVSNKEANTNVKNNVKENKNPAQALTKHCCVTLTPTDLAVRGPRVPPPPPSPGGTNNKNTKKVAAAPAVPAPVVVSVLKEKDVFLAPPPPTAKGKKIVAVVEKKKVVEKREEPVAKAKGGGEAPGVVVPSVQTIQASVPLPPPSSQDQEQGQEAQGGRSLRARGPNKKAITEKAFLQSELAGVVPYALASQCRIVSGRFELACQKFDAAGERFEKQGNTILANLGASIRKLREKRKNDKRLGEIDDDTGNRDETEEPPPRQKSKSSKRLRAPSNERDELEPEFEFENSNKDGSIDMFEPEEEDKIKAPNKISFDFIAAAEQESVPVQPSKKIILDPTGNAIPITTKTRGSSQENAEKETSPKRVTRGRSGSSTANSTRNVDSPKLPTKTVFEAKEKQIVTPKRVSNRVSRTESIRSNASPITRNANTTFDVDDEVESKNKSSTSTPKRNSSKSVTVTTPGRRAITAAAGKEPLPLQGLKKKDLDSAISENRRSSSLQNLTPKRVTRAGTGSSTRNINSPKILDAQREKQNVTPGRVTRGSGVSLARSQSTDSPGLNTTFDIDVKTPPRKKSSSKSSKSKTDATFFVKPAEAAAAEAQLADDEDDEEDIFQDVFENSCMLLNDGDPVEPVVVQKKAIKTFAPDDTYVSKSNPTFAPDDTYLNSNPDATYVTDGPDFDTRSNKTKTLNQTVSLPGGSSYGKHVPQFPDFSSSRHQLSTLDVLEEEDDADASPASLPPKSIFPDAAGEKKKTSTSSSSSSASSYKSALSHLPPKKVIPVIPVTNTAKFDAIKKKEEDAKRNKEENLKRKKDLQKKKNEEWKQRADKIRQEQQKIPATTVSTSVKKTNPIAPPVLLHKPPFVINKPPRLPGTGPPSVTANLVSAGVQRMIAMDGFNKASGPMKSYIKQGHTSSKPSPLMPPASSYTSMGGIKPLTPIMSIKTLSRAASDGDAFKTPGQGHNMSVSFLDHTCDSGPGNSYDITLYEDLDDELSHRKGKPVPEWAKNKNQIAISLLKQIGCGEIKGVGFPFPPVEKGYRLFE